MNGRIIALSAALVVSLVGSLGTVGCATTAKNSDAARRRDLVFVPQSAQPVDQIRWSSVRGVRPLNRRMVLFTTRDRPYLLVLQRPCTGLTANAVIVTSGTTFEPRRDPLEVFDPQLGGGAVLCRGDTLYAISDEDVVGVIRMVEPE
jgi:hypothetical protein